MRRPEGWYVDDRLLPINYRRNQSITWHNGDTIPLYIAQTPQTVIYLNNFTYYEGPSIQRIYPTHGPWRGGYNVTIFGKHFQDSSLLVCRFKRTIISAWWLNATRIICRIPTAANIDYGNVTLTVTIFSAIFYRSHE